MTSSRGLLSNKDSAILFCVTMLFFSHLFFFLVSNSEWDIYVYKTPFATGEMPEDIESTRYTFDPRNGTTSVLDGSIVTEEGKDHFQVFVPFSLLPC